MPQKIVTNLWFDTQAEEAAQFYTSLFQNSQIVAITRYGEAGPGTPGSVLTVKFTIDGQEFIGINGGPDFKFTEAISLMVNCDNQQEIDRLWNILTADGGEESMCGWLKDKYGLSWQIVPTTWDEMMTRQGANHEQKLNKAMEALYQMKKIDVQALEDAYNQG